MITRCAHGHVCPVNAGRALHPMLLDVCEGGAMFDPAEPIGTALNDAKYGERVSVALNENGMAWLLGDDGCSQILWTDRGAERCGQDTPCPDHDWRDESDG